MNNNIFRWRHRCRRTPGTLSSRECETPHLLKGIKFAIFSDRYDFVTPFGREVQEGPPPLSPEPWFERLGIIPRTKRQIYQVISSLFASKQNLTALQYLFSYALHVQIPKQHPEYWGDLCPFNSVGVVSSSDVIPVICPGKTVLVILMLANNKLGALQPMAKVDEHCLYLQVLFHTDAISRIICWPHPTTFQIPLLHRSLDDDGYAAVAERAL